MAHTEKLGRGFDATGFNGFSERFKVDDRCPAHQHENPARSYQRQFSRSDKSLVFGRYTREDKYRVGGGENFFQRSRSTVVFTQQSIRHPRVVSLHGASKRGQQTPEGTSEVPETYNPNFAPRE